ncbi:unnamed protein product [Microthlaspi erraticum]|uniref:HMA domain-containing protein n=1 Tax=Microthlaspi erraticum TaxID=1685480 RepID=A0A6D2JVX7_9BRAS|nr:unnamed protein product [Microthlaspi erraticum]
MTSVGKEKVTWMKLETAQLDDHKSYCKVKKALCSLQEVIRDQTFDEKNNTVTIKVVCCSPEKVMNKLCSKGKGYIKKIHMTDPPKSQAEKPKVPEKPKEAEKPKDADKPKDAEKPKDADKPKPSTAVATHAYHEPMMGTVAYNDPYHGSYYGSSSNQPIGYPSRPVYENWGGGPPPPWNHHGGGPNYFSDENLNSSCCIM